MADSIDVKKGIAEMYSAMSRGCQKQAEAIRKDFDNYVIDDLKMGYEFDTNDGKTYQLICELKIGDKV